jgi:hypothetical protein
MRRESGKEESVENRKGTTRDTELLAATDVAELVGGSSKRLEMDARCGPPSTG